MLAVLLLRLTTRHALRWRSSSENALDIENKDAALAGLQNKRSRAGRPE
jgi:hypothetical protein